MLSTTITYLFFQITFLASLCPTKRLLKVMVTLDKKLHAWKAEQYKLMTFILYLECGENYSTNMAHFANKYRRTSLQT